MFSMFDPTGSGSISRSQYKSALSSFGIDEQTVEVGDKIDRETFERCVGEELEKLSLS